MLTLLAVLLVADATTYVLPAAMLVAAILIGSGGVGMYLKYHTRLAIIEKTANEAKGDISDHSKDLAGAKERVSILENTMKEIRDSLTSLNVVHQIKSQVDVLTARLDDSRKETADVKTDLKVFMQSITKERVAASRKARKKRK